MKSTQTNFLRTVRLLAAVTGIVIGTVPSLALELRWNVASGDWFDDTNWDLLAPFYPGEFGPSDQARIWNNGTADFDATGRGLTNDTVTLTLVHLGTDSAQPPGTGDGFLNVIGGTMKLVDADRDAIKIGTGINKTGAINQTGGTVELTQGGFRIGGGRGDGNGSFNTMGESGTYTITGGSMIAGSEIDFSVIADADNSDEASNSRIVVGENDGNGELNIIGTGPTAIDTPDRFEVEANGRLNITLDAGGVTPISAGRPGSMNEPRFDAADSVTGETGSDPGAMLNVDFSALTTIIGDILLIDNRSDDTLIDRFTNAADGATLHTFTDGSSYQLDYDYEAGTDGLTNDLALVAVAAPGLPGDFDGDGDVDGADFLAWQRGEVSMPPAMADLVTWQDNYGGPPPSAALATIPEPTTLLLFAFFWFSRRWKQS